MSLLLGIELFQPNRDICLRLIRLKMSVLENILTTGRFVDKRVLISKKAKKKCPFLLFLLISSIAIYNKNLIDPMLNILFDFRHFGFLYNRIYIFIIINLLFSKK